MENKPTYKVEYLERYEGWYGTLGLKVEGVNGPDFEHHETQFFATKQAAKEKVLCWSKKLYGCNPVKEDAWREEEHCDCGECGR